MALADMPGRLAIARAGEQFAAFTLDDGYRNDTACPASATPSTVHGLRRTWSCLQDARHLVGNADRAVARAAPHLEFDFGSGPITMPLATPDQTGSLQPLRTLYQSEVEEAVAIGRLRYGGESASTR